MGHMPRQPPRYGYDPRPPMYRGPPRGGRYPVDEYYQP